MSNYQNYRFTLKPYDGLKSRYKCPRCGQNHTFSPYIDNTTGSDVGLGVGRCDREVKCGYHYTPASFFRRNPSYTGFYIPQNKVHVPVKAARQRCDFISPDKVQQSLNCYDQNNLAGYLHSLFGAQVTDSLLKKFHTGTSNHWSGATVFWQIDKDNNVRTGKVMLYDSSTGHRVKANPPKIQWAHKLLKLEGYDLDQCLFGEHQLTQEPISKPIAIVESEKTAMIASAYMPTYIWMATGGICNLTAGKLSCLAGRDVLLWPDLGAYDKWTAKVKEIETDVNCKLLISDVLEANASAEDRDNGLDIADYLVGSKVTISPTTNS